MSLILEKSEQFISNHGRALEKALFNFEFKNGSKSSVINELGRFQNEDGGFGHGIEPDLQLPSSTAISSWRALRLMLLVECDRSEPILLRTLEYLEKHFNSSRNGWDVVTKEVDLYPHAPWWSYKFAMKHFGWGNPSAEILGFFIKFNGQSKLTTTLPAVAMKRINLVKKGDFHEVDCFKKLYNLAGSELRGHLREPLITLMRGSVERDTSKWSSYVAKPLMFINDPLDELLSVFDEQLIEANLEFIENSFDYENGCWQPNWDWSGDYPEQWLKAKSDWQTILTLENLLKLRAFGRI